MIEGIKEYQGHLVHSARWDDEYDVDGKTVGIIGCGSAAIQIVPIIQKSQYFLNFQILDLVAW